MFPALVTGLLVSAAALGASAPTNSAGVRAVGECASLLPAGLVSALGRTFPAAKVVGVADLDAEARAGFAKASDRHCPGIVHLDFFGTNADAYGILLLIGTGGHPQSELVMAAHEAESTEWTLRLLVESGDGPPNLPFLAKDKPGEYTDVYGEKKIRVLGEALLWVQGSSVVIVFGWTGNDVDKVWLRD
jgi:hypothetical protein